MIDLIKAIQQFDNLVYVVASQVVVAVGLTGVPSLPSPLQLHKPFAANSRLQFALSYVTQCSRLY